VTADDVVALLDLSPHPEGGYYRQTWADDGGTAIYFLLRAGHPSAWHRVHGRAEVWHFYAGDPLELTVDGRDRPGEPGEPGTSVGSAGDPNGESTTVLGADLAAGQLPQAVVPAGWWQRATTTGEWTLVGCTVAPPFTFDVFELA